MKRFFFTILIAGVCQVAVANDTIVVSSDELESAGANVQTAEKKSSGSSVAASWQDDSLDEIVIGEDEISSASNVQSGEWSEVVVRRRFWLPTGINLPSLNISPKIDVELPDVKIKFPSFSHKTVVYTTAASVNRRFYPVWHYRRPLRHHRFQPRCPAPRCGPLRSHLSGSKPSGHSIPGRRKFKMPGKPGPRPPKVVPPKRKR